MKIKGTYGYGKHCLWGKCSSFHLKVARQSRSTTSYKENTMEQLGHVNRYTLAWSANLKRISTCDALSQKGILIHNTRCPCCGDHEKSRDHIFTSCKFIN